MAKTDKSQSGNVHLIIIIVLTVALLSTLGFVFWQNFMQPKNTTPAVVTDVNKGYLVLNDWGVKFKLPTNLGSNKINYDLRAGKDFEAYVFSTSRVEALGGQCLSTDQNFINLGTISRSTSLSTAMTSPPTLAGKIGDYYYYYQHPQSICSSVGSSEDINQIQIEDIAVIQSLLMSVEKK